MIFLLCEFENGVRLLVNRTFVQVRACLSGYMAWQNSSQVQS